MLETKGNVLVVDDDPLVRMNYADLLEDEHYGVTEADSFIQGFNAVQGRDFDLIICDHDLGDGKGIDIIKDLIARGKDIPVIYLSGAQMQVLDEVGQLSIVRAVLAKPVSEQQVLEAVEEHISVNDYDAYPKLIGDDERNQLLNNFFFKTDSE